MIDEAQRAVSKSQHRVSLTESALKVVDNGWPDLAYRLHVAPGKTVMSEFNAEMQERGLKPVRATTLAASIRRSEMDAELVDVIERLEASI